MIGRHQSIETMWDPYIACVIEALRSSGYDYDSTSEALWDSLQDIKYTATTHESSGPIYDCCRRDP